MDQSVGHRIRHSGATSNTSPCVWCPPRRQRGQSTGEPRNCLAYRRLPLAASVLALLAVQSSQADDREWLDAVTGLHPFAALTVTSDSNLFRRPDGPGDKSDTYLIVEAGFNSEIRASRQRFVIDGRIFHNYYDRFDSFDYTGGNATVAWKWVAGKLWDGEVGYSFNRKQRDFANQLVPTKDIQNRNNLYATANRWLTTRWRIGTAIDWTDISYSESDSLNKTRYDFGANLDYITKAGNTLGITASYSPSSYSDRADLDYEEVTVGPTARWLLTAKTRLRASAGYKVRSYDQADERNFDGFIGSIRAIWEATGKTRVEAAVWQEISNLGDEIANYAIIDGVSLEPKWQVTAKTALRAIASYERRDFQRIPEDEVTTTLPDRVDDVGTLGLWLDWQPRRHISFAIGVQAESRDSTDPLWQYDDQYVQARVSVGL